MFSEVQVKNNRVFCKEDRSKGILQEKQEKEDRIFCKRGRNYSKGEGFSSVEV
jgi:hypothetical protein